MRTEIEVPARLDGRFGLAPLAVVVAPAGFGKTTLLRSWQRRAGNTPMELVSFDAFHRSNALDAGRALAAGIAAVGVAPELAQDLTALIPADGESFGADFVQSVGNALRSLPHRFALFLDDVQALALATARDLGRLVPIAADDHHRFVVATRSEPPWPTHRWRVAGFADLLTAEDLRLTDDEIADVLGPELAAVAPRVAAATRGWPAALEAVRWRLQVDPSVEIEVAVLDLVDYVAAEVLPALGDSDVQIRANPLAAAIAKVAYASMTGWATDPREALVLSEEGMPALTALDAGARLPNAPRYPGVASYALAAEIASSTRRRPGSSECSTGRRRSSPAGYPRSAGGARRLGRR